MFAINHINTYYLII